MISKSRMIVRNLNEIPYIPTSHNIGEKQVLLSKDETESPVTQIAKHILQGGSYVEEHAHPTMDEHFIFLDGDGEININGLSIKCTSGLFVLVPATASHSVKAYTNLIFITFSVAI